MGTAQLTVAVRPLPTGHGWLLIQTPDGATHLLLSPDVAGAAEPRHLPGD